MQEVPAKKNSAGEAGSLVHARFHAPLNRAERSFRRPWPGTVRLVAAATVPSRWPAQLLLMAFQAKRTACVCYPQQFGYAAGVVHIVAGRTFQLGRIKRYACYHQRPAGRTDETNVRSRQGRIVGETDRVVVGQTPRGSTQNTARQVRGCSDCGGSSRLATKVVNRHRAVMAGQAKLGDRTRCGLT